MKEKLIKALQKTSGFIRAHKIRIAAGAVIIVLLLAGGITAVVLSQKEPSAKGAEPQNTVEKVADGVPRACGGDPITQVVTEWLAKCSPHMRG